MIPSSYHPSKGYSEYIPPNVHSPYEKAIHPSQKEPETITITMTINSRNRDILKYTEPNKYSIPLNTIYTNVRSIEVIDASLPRADYNISTANNTFWVQEGSNTPFKISVTPGFYFETNLGTGDAVKDLAKVIENQLNTDPNSSVGWATNYTVSINTTTRKTTISNAYTTENFALLFGTGSDIDIWKVDSATGQHIHVQSGTTIRRVLGFARTDLNTSNSYTSPYFIDLNQKDKYIALYIDQIRSHAQFSNDEGANRCLAKFYMDDAEFHKRKIFISGGFEHTFSKFRQPLNKLDRLDIEWRTQDSKLYEFHGIDHVFTLQIVVQADSYKFY